jgi:hypothetical protein
LSPGPVITLTTCYRNHLNNVKNYNSLSNFPLFDSVISNLLSAEKQNFILRYLCCRSVGCRFDSVAPGGLTTRHVARPLPCFSVLGRYLCNSSSNNNNNSNTNNKLVLFFWTLFPLRTYSFLFCGWQ